MAERWSDGDVDSVAPSAPRGFPSHVPEPQVVPEFEWRNRNADSVAHRRSDYQRSLPPMTSLTAHRRPGYSRGQDIDQDIYLKRQDEENRRTCR